MNKTTLCARLYPAAKAILATAGQPPPQWLRASGHVTCVDPAGAEIPAIGHRVGVPGMEEAPTHKRMT